MPNPAPKPFLDLLEQRLRELGLSKRRFADLTGIHYNTVSRYSRDITPTDATLKLMAPVLRVSLNELRTAVGRLDEDEVHSDAAMAGLIADFRAAVRDIPRQFWPTVIAANRSMADWMGNLPTDVTNAGDVPVTTPKLVGNGGTEDDEANLPIWKQGHAPAGREIVTLPGLTARNTIVNPLQRVTGLVTG